MTAGVIAGEGLGSASARESYIGILNYFGETEDNRTLGELGSDFVLTGGLNAAAGPVLAKFWQGIKATGNSVRYLADTMSCLLYTSPSPRDGLLSRMPSSA